MWRDVQVGVGVAGVVLALSAACTTYMEPVTCEGARYQCNEHDDVRFCEYLAVDVQGVDCARLGITAGRNFCVVSPSPCVDTHYELKDGDCNVTHYVAERESFTCTSGTPTFLSR